jgi:hypothetical protein
MVATVAAQHVFARWWWRFRVRLGSWTTVALQPSPAVLRRSGICVWGGCGWRRRHRGLSGSVSRLLRSGSLMGRAGGLCSVFGVSVLAGPPRVAGVRKLDDYG